MTNKIPNTTTGNQTQKPSEIGCNDLLAYLGEDATNILLARLIKATRDVEALINESRGVEGLHQNGDIAPWEELLSGGRYEEWLDHWNQTVAFLNEHWL